MVGMGGISAGNEEADLYDRLLKWKCKSQGADKIRKIRKICAIEKYLPRYHAMFKDAPF